MSSEEDEEDEEGEGEEGDKGFTWSGVIENYESIGPGFATYVDGDEFWGSYYGGNRNSFGKYTFVKTGATYEGNYTNNQKAGFGTMTYPDKSVYTVSWFQDTRSGEGQYTYANGDIYKGRWPENNKHCVGTYFFKNTMAQASNPKKSLRPTVVTDILDLEKHHDNNFIGDWEKGFFVKGKWLFRNGDFHEGDFAKSKPEGPGKFMFFKPKSTVTGTFEKSKWTLGSTKQHLQK